MCENEKGLLQQKSEADPKFVLSEKMCSQFFAGLSAEISRRNIKNSLAACHAIVCHALYGSCIGNNYAGGELGVRVKCEPVLDDMGVFLVDAGFAGAENKSAVSHSAVVTQELVLVNEVNNGVVICKVVGHFLDLLFYRCSVCTLFKNYEAFSEVLVSGGKNRILAASYGFKSLVYGNGVLLCVLYALYPANGVRMSLAYALAPEGVVLAVRKDSVCINSVKSEQTGIPAD